MANHQRETQEQLAQRLAGAAQKVEVGARYEHYKKLTYKVLLLALREEDNEPCVVYQAEYGEHVTFTRPVANWLEMVDVDGQIVPRFRKV
jgi:hypothetical protein